MDAVYYVMKDIWRDVYEMHENALKNTASSKTESTAETTEEEK